MEQQDKRMKSKLFIFFEWVFNLLVSNVLILLPIVPTVAYFRFFVNEKNASNPVNIAILAITLALFAVSLFPNITACTKTMKDGIETDIIFKTHFRNLKECFKKSFVLGIIFFIILSIIIFGLLFYIFQDFNSIHIDQTLFEKIGEKASSAGVVVMFVAMIFLLLMASNVPLIIINFKKLTVGEIIRSAFYLAFRYFLTTFILFILLVFSVGIGILCFLSQMAILLLLWMMIGISLPIMLGTKITKPIFYMLEKKQFERIMHYDEEDDLDDLEC